MTNNELIIHQGNQLPAEHQEANDDLNYTRKNVYELIETGMAGIAEYAEIARQSQNPGAYDVLFKAIQQLTNANKALAEITVKRRDEAAVEKEKEEEESKEGGKTIQNLFVGSTAELGEMLKMIEAKKEK